MPYIRVWIHYVWATKNREPILQKEARQLLFDHIYDNARAKSIFIEEVNGYLEHVHCLVSLGSDQSISKVAQLLKGESSFWFNQQNLIKGKLEWQDEFFAVSVSESRLEDTKNYIRNQEEHHRKKTFQEEYDEFIAKYHFKKILG